MFSFIRNIAIILMLFFLVDSVAYSLETREKVTELNAGKTTIVFRGDEQVITMNGPIDFTQEGMTFEGNHGRILCYQNPATKDFNIKNLEFDGSIRYKDKQGYKGTCGFASYDFDKTEAFLRGNVKIEGADMLLKGDEITYNSALEKFTASKKVYYEGTARLVPLLVEKDRSDKSPFHVECDKIVVDRKEGKSHAEGLIKFVSVGTTIECGEVYIEFQDKDITSINAFKGVKFTDPEMSANGESALYDKANSTLTLQGGPSNRSVEIVYKGQDFSGREVIVNLTDGREITLGEGKAKIKTVKKKI